jgi:hypothetical protein
MNKYWIKFLKLTVQMAYNLQEYDTNTHSAAQVWLQQKKIRTLLWKIDTFILHPDHAYVSGSQTVPHEPLGVSD